MIYATSQGTFDKTTKFLEVMSSGKIYDILNSYGLQGVDALSSATPRETGETAQAWGYQVEITQPKVKLLYLGLTRTKKEECQYCSDFAIWAWNWHRGLYSGKRLYKPSDASYI